MLAWVLFLLSSKVSELTCGAQLYRETGVSLVTTHN
uniref:Uncharacterized protein n=1 Tax=Arundo donax TaxID=35708 RepID=A0A0A9E6K4_ARUDO